VAWPALPWYFSGRFQRGPGMSGMVQRNILALFLCFCSFFCAGGCSSLLVASNAPALDDDVASTTWSTRMTSMQQQWAKVSREIQADLNYEDSSGLDSFDPIASAQVRYLRNELK